MGLRGGILLFSPIVWAGSGGGRGGRHTGTHTGTYTRMLHLPFSDLPLKKCPKHAASFVVRAVNRPVVSGITQTLIACPPDPENCSRLFFALWVILILQGYFQRPSAKTFLNKHKSDMSKVFYLARLFLPCKVKGKNNPKRFLGERAEKNGGIFAIAIANFDRRPEIAAISDTLLKIKQRNMAN